MARNSLESISRAVEQGDYPRALSMGWSLASDSAMQRDAEAMSTLGAMATQISLDVSGKVADDARSLSAYCSASAQAPHEAITSFFDPRSWFGRRETRKKCPDCAEGIAREARVCRFCGYRYPDDSA